MNIQRVNILGVNVSAINMIQALEVIQYWIDTNQKEYICVTPAHTVMDCYQHPHLRKILNASGLTTPDGMSIVWLLRLYGFAHVQRVYGPDLMLAVCEVSQRQHWKHFFYGGALGVPEQLVARLKFQFSDLRVVGTYSPPFRQLSPVEEEELIDRVNALHPDIIWVGIGTPKQEEWMSKYLGKLNASVLVGVGAAFDFLSGNKRQAPRWVQRSGLEWLFRLTNEPRRLWPRYIKYPYFILLILFQLIGVKRYSPE